MKKILIVSLLVIPLLLSSCEKKTSPNDDSAEIEGIIPPYFQYVPYSEASEISEILNNNSIDKLYFEEWNTDAILTTVDIVNLYQKYLNLWQNELDIVVEKIKGNISGEVLEEFEISQKAWESFYETNPNLAVDIYSSRMGTGSITHQLYGDKALWMIRYRTLELAEYCYLLTGTFEFEFHE